MNSLEDYEKHSANIIFPCVLKPFWRSQKWLNARFRKVYVFDSKSELEKGLEYIAPVENNLIIQQYIPGGDREVYFHLMYYNSQSECIGEFTGRKLRQWPPGVGQTSCGEPAPWAEKVREESIRLFNQLKYKGFGSVEYRRHPDEDKFYITEPTVGRQNAQSFLATINGTRMSTIAYSALTGRAFPAPALSEKKKFWIDDQFDVFSIAVSMLKGRLNIKDVFRSYLGKKKFRLSNLKDIRVILYCWTVVLFSKLFQKIRKKCILRIRY
jgi:predicted ATP-grasp superfamily ATP-dependent carboligase